NSEYAGMVGGAVHWQDGGETFNTFENEILQYTIDASVEGNGWNLFGTFVGRHVEIDVDPDDIDRDDFGFLVQGGVFVTPQTELFARWDSVIPDDGDENDDWWNTITGGV